MFHPHSDKDRQIKALAACKDRIKGRLEAACNLASAQAHGPDGAWTSKLAWKWCCPVVMKRFDTNTTRATDVIEIPICRGDCLVECTVVLLWTKEPIPPLTETCISVAGVLGRGRVWWFGEGCEKKDASSCRLCWLSVRDRACRSSCFRRCYSSY
jgi:hypothetical protein